MTRIQRRLLIDTSVIGLTITLFVTILDLTTIRLIRPIDDWFYDKRAQLCQFFTPKTTDKLMHVDIDDQALATIGQWPWPRAQMAELIDEIDRAGAKAISMDIIFSEPSNPSPRIEKLGPGRYGEIDDDALFAAAIRRSGRCLIPVALSSPVSTSPVYSQILEYLRADLEINEVTCYQRLLAEPSKILPVGSPFPTFLYLAARRQAMNTRLMGELASGDVPFETLRARLLPKTAAEVKSSPLLRLLAEERQKVLAIAPLKRLMRPIPPGLPQLARYDSELAAILPFSQASMSSGYVNFVQTSESGVVRAIPLWCDYRGQLFPQTDLSLACAFLGSDVNAVQLRPDKVVIPKAPGMERDVQIPVHNLYSPEFGRDVGMFMDVPVRGNRDWATMYDWPQFKRTELHVPITTLWQPHEIRERIARNNASIDQAISTILNDDAPHQLALDPARAKKYLEHPPAAEDTEARREIVKWTREQLKESGLLQILDPNYPLGRPLWLWFSLPPMFQSAIGMDNGAFRQRDELESANAALSTLIAQNDRFTGDLTDLRARLKYQLGGKAVMIGWVATGKTDFFPTAIQPQCPGVVIHGMVFNAIMTYAFWHHLPAWVTAVVTIGIGVLVTAANAFLRPPVALLAAVAIGAIYLLANGLWLFDYHRICVGVGGPMVALISVWATGALAGFLIEKKERALITKRFSTYVDQKLVDFVIENPDATLDGQVREMSVIFTDLAGFTGLSEQLRERTVTILSEYLGLMVPVIRANDGLVNKFLGDGIMCFFNAPTDDPEHAVHAVKTALDMQRQMRVFADRLVTQGLPRLHMRCGVSTGTMVVGDSGPKDASDYTVLGDTVNFASRLESANKALGTSILMSHRTTELLGENRFLLRPVGKLQVVGKTEGVMTYEPLAPFDDASPADLICAMMSTEMIAAYLNRDFNACIGFAEQMDQQIGASKLASLYRKASEQLLKNPPGAEFQGNLILTEK